MAHTDIEQLLAGRPEPAARPVPGRKMFGPPSDEPFAKGLATIEAPAVLGATFGIEYRDAAGEDSIRTIRCQRAARSPSGTVYLVAWCLLRQAWRTFRLDRIEAVFDYLTGEIEKDTRAFLTALVGDYEAGPARETRSGMLSAEHYTACREAATALLFLAMADGTVDDAEIVAIRRYVDARVARINPKATIAAASLMSWLRNHVPDRKQAMAGLRHTMDDVTEGAALADAIFDVLLADGTASEEELALVRRFVGSMERREKRNNELQKAARAADKGAADGHW
jgi:uncharacterized tellurite resistance protein B-like protein